MAADIELSNTIATKDINILLLGETGVGKSTFINSFLNYIQFDTFEDACRNYQHVHCVIPTKFTILDDEFVEKTLEFGYCANENTVAGESATLKTKSYVIQIPKYNINLRLIDTPGIGDTHGIVQDEKNQKNIIDYLSSIDYIHAVCVLLKPNQARCTIPLQYCCNQLFMYLHKIAVQNIMFVFTNTCNSFFTPGETIHSLQQILKHIEEEQNVTIPAGKDNLFCVDNESFRYLLAKKDNIAIAEEKIFSSSFSHSNSECWRIVECAMRFKPFAVDDILYLYKVREKFNDLCNSLSDMSDLLKSDSALLKKLYDAASDGCITSQDATSHIEEIKARISNNEMNKSNLLMQISKFVRYLQTNAILVHNNYCQEYVKYLIDREMSKGAEADRRCIRDYHMLISYYENIKRIVDMNIHVRPVSPILTREELSSTWPNLERSIFSNSRHENEIILGESKTLHMEEQPKSSTEDKSEPYKFRAWYEVIKDSVLFVADQVGKALEYEDMWKAYVEQENSNASRRRNFHTNRSSNKFSNNQNVPFKKRQSHLNKKIKDGLTSASPSTMTERLSDHSHHNIPNKINSKVKSSNRRRDNNDGFLCNFDFIDDHSDHNVHVRNQHRNKTRGEYCGYSGDDRGNYVNRGRGKFGGQHSCSRQPQNNNANTWFDTKQNTQNQAKFTGERKFQKNETVNISINLQAPSRNQQCPRKERSRNTNTNEQFGTKQIPHNQPKNTGEKKSQKNITVNIPNNLQSPIRSQLCQRKERNRNTNTNEQFSTKQIAHNQQKLTGERQSRENKTPDIPNNLLESMKNIFD